MRRWGAATRCRASCASDWTPERAGSGPPFPIFLEERRIYDGRIWEFEESLWTGDAAHYHELIDAECVMVVPAPPFVMKGEQAIEAVSHTPRWETVEFSGKQVVRPQEGLIVIAYKAKATRSGSDSYTAYCTTTLRRLAHDEWRVVQHQQTLQPIAHG